MTDNSCGAMKRSRAESAQRRATEQDESATGRRPAVAGDTELADIEIAIGGKVRELRGRMNASSRSIASRAGISIALLSRIEHGKVSPSLGTLNRLAGALGVPFTALFQQVDNMHSASLVRADSGQQVERAGTSAGQRYQLLGTPIEGEVQVEPYLISIDERTRPSTSFQHDGVELIHVLEGGVVYSHNNRSYRLRQGDTLFFDARSPHGPSEFISVPTKYLAIICYKRN